MDVEREELGIHARALNSALIGMYKRNLLGFMRACNLINLNFFARTTVSVFYGTPSSTYKATQILVDEEPARKSGS